VYVEHRRSPVLLGVFAHTEVKGVSELVYFAHEARAFRRR
jgi:hypothetical protein